ncbi:Alpha/Beta hydrolase protein [Mycena alexandri]|uniref:Alpha/Beta hydrolase protein n=1 Tax=Mycena alexandri TaxID=1745969 RepID=A0AAD6S9D3_9AGAR|nr:Alpha/Beta hydrolase protein [Mycena alexandri]
MYFAPALAFALQLSVGWAASISVQTTSGLLQGSQTNGLSTFKGIRFGQSPTGSLRWEPPVAFTSTASQNATTFGPACVQQFPFAGAAINEKIFNTPPVPESEDCLFLNVWAPTSTTPTPVLIWIYGGALTFGTAATPEYDGSSLAASQNITVVSFNYRTNVFGFPTAPDLPTVGNNLELAFQWVQTNIAKFGADPKQVTIMGQSAGARSVASAYASHAPGTAPFRAAIMLSAAVESRSPTPNFAAFNAMATALGCTQAPGAARLACLKNVSATTIRAYTNGASSGTWTSMVDNVTVFSDPIQRIRNKQTAGVPFIIGNAQDDGSLFAINQNNLSIYLTATFGTLVTPAQVRALYTSGLSDNLVISEVVKDFVFLCPAELWGAAAVGAGQPNVYRYAYGASFANMQPFVGAGAWHSSDLFEIFGTYNRTGATTAEATLSSTMQTIYGNFVKDPTTPPAPHWAKYVPGKTTTTLAKLAYNGNVALSNVVQAAESNSLDSPCDTLWNKFLDVRE